jgi:WD40 repeat protein
MKDLLMPSALHEKGSRSVLNPLPPDLGFCLVVPEFLSRQECQHFIDLGERSGFATAATDYPPSYRNNERLVMDDASLAGWMLERMQAHAPKTFALQENQTKPQDWTLDSVNERFRFCRYRPGQQFNIHQDGVHHRGDALRSCLTFMIYLTDGDDFEGGDTLFFRSGPAAHGTQDRQPCVVARVRPRAGSLILFDHAIWHAGATVTAGVKHILRSDVLYRRPESPAQAEAVTSAAFTPAHQGYVWALASLGGGRIASGGRDAVIRLWHKTGEPAGQLAGHTRSVLGLAALGNERLASVSRDRSLRIWNLAAQRCEQTYTPHDTAALCVARLGDGEVATGGADGWIRRCHLKSGEITPLGSHEGWVWAIEPVGESLLASASEDGSARLWDTASGRCVASLGNSTVPLRTLAVAADQHRIATGNADGIVTLWVQRQGHWQASMTLQAHQSAVRRVRFLDAVTLATAGEDNCVRLWHLPQAALCGEKMHRNFATDVLALDEKTCLSCSYDGTIQRHQRRPSASAGVKRPIGRTHAAISSGHMALAR